MRILLTGAAGFVGSHLADRLLADGHEVIGVDDLSTGRRRNLAHLDGHPGWSFREHDVTASVDAAGPLEWVLHLAGLASPARYLADPIAALRVSSEGTFRLLELARETGASFFLASTSEVYGDPERHPQSEEYFGRVDPTGPRSAYNEGKRFAEALVSAFCREAGVPVRIARIFNAYGPRLAADDGRVIPTFVRQALRGEPLTVHGDGSQTRSFQYVDDLVEAIIRLLDVDHAGPVNIGNPDEISVLELAHTVRSLAGGTAPIVFRPLPAGDPRQRRPDIALARRLLDWEPGIGLEEGLSRTIEHLRTDEP